MIRPAKVLVGCAIFLFFVGASERAAHFESARGSVALSERVERGNYRNSGSYAATSGPAARSESACGASSIGPGRAVPTVTSCGEPIPLTATRHQKKPLRWWVAKARQNKRDANARGRTIRRLQGTLRRGFIPWYWVAVGSCESGLRWSYNGPSGFDGAVQFHPGTWSANRLSGYPRFAYQASPFQQLVVAEIVLAASGWGQWPACSRRLGLR